MPAIWQNPSSRWRQRTKAIEPVPGGMRQKRAAEPLGAGVGAGRNRVKAYREGGMAALRPENRDAGQADKPAMRRDRDVCDAETPRRRVEEPELGNALMREVTEAFAVSRGRYGYHRVKALLRTGVSEKALRRIMAEDGLTAHVPKRRGYGSYEGETTPAPGNLVNRDFTAEMPNEKWPADITEIKARDGKVYLSPPVDCYDGKIVTYTAGSGPNAGLADRMLVKSRGDAAGGGASPGAFRPRMPLPVAQMAGAHGPLRPGTVDGREGLFPGQRRRGGVPRAHEDGIRLSRALGGAYP
ncbi:IS3 family transposase [Bifidobacterium thermophilum]|uniref:IS3 family transposase n=3 Tax=Bifidobacterium thermophilum TaxID=33905 RepID=UPI003F8E199B